MSELFLGLISGTSADGIDAALVAFGDSQMSVMAAHTTPYSDELRIRIESTIRSGKSGLKDLAELDIAIGDAFAHAALHLLTESGVDPASVSAIGSHGQTVCHHPGFSTLQLGDPNRIASSCGIPVVADFRRADMAVSGQGAPFAPLFHLAAFGSQHEPRAVLNLGGIANLSVLGVDGFVTGFDTGPANTLMDGWAQQNGLGSMDEEGAFAASGRVDGRLLELMKQDAYFALPPPKSTGRELFNMEWLDQYIDGKDYVPADIQATLAELSATVIADAIRDHAPLDASIFACGGGVHNQSLMARLQKLIGARKLQTTAELGVDPDHVEAAAFAWLARERIHARSPDGLRSVTGASMNAVLGGVWLPPRIKQRTKTHNRR